MSLPKSEIKRIIEKAIGEENGILRLEPAWVARVFLPPGRRLGLQGDQYLVGERGSICERWLASTTDAENPISVPDEGQSFLKLRGGERIRLKDAVAVAGEMIMGEEYARTHNCLGRLAKIFDYADRLPFHFHQMEHHARLVGSNSKEEAYYFPEDVDLGPSPETFFGVHPYISQEKKYDILLPYLIEWKDDAILQHSRAFKQIPDDGFHVPAGILHAPGSALTIEFQEDSDVYSFMQAKAGGKIISKELLFKDVTPEKRKKLGERAILEMIDWEVCGDPYFYENRHTPPLLIAESVKENCAEYWIYYNTRKFSGKKLIVHPGKKYISRENGVYNILIWRGKGKFGELEVEGGNFDLDELFVCHDRAVNGIEIENNSNKDLILFKFFGPDINTDVPMLKPYKQGG